MAESRLAIRLTAPGLLRSLAHNWWLLLRAPAAVSFGVLAFFWPDPTLITLTWLWGAYALSDGVIAIRVAFNASGGNAGPRRWLGVSGVVSVVAGVVAFWYTGMTTLVLLMFIAAFHRRNPDLGRHRAAKACRSTNGCSSSMARCRWPSASF